VRDVVAAAARRQRTQAAVRRAAAGAPIAAVGLAAFAAVSRLAGWPALIPIALWMLVAAAWSLTVLRARRPRASTDAMAASVDEAAGLDGELRSAHWFASQGQNDAWTSFHVDQASRHAAGVDWQQVFPPVAARRAWAATAVLTAVTFGIPLAVPSIGLRLWPAAVSARASSDRLDALPADLRQQLVNAAAAIAKGVLSPEQALATLTQSASFNDLDAETKRQIAALLEKAQTDGSSKVFAGAGGGDPVSADAARWAKENLDMLLAGQQATEQTDREAETAKQNQAEERNEYTEEGAAGEVGEASDFQASTRVRTKPTGAPESTQPMPMTGSPDASGEAGTGFGGKHGDVRYGTTTAGDLAAAFRQEVIEADRNTNGATHEREARRRTESGRSAMSFTGAASATSFDQARVDAPRAVPEARRPLVERYFVRPAEPVEAPPPAAPSSDAR
jgi:hypothetical protein